MNNDLRKSEIVRLIRQLAEQNNGVAPGQTKFQTDTGIKPHEWRGKMWRSWSDALAEAGYAARSWVAQIPAEEIFAAVAALARRLEKFPNSNDLLFESAHNPEFPGQKTISQRWSMADLAANVQEFALSREMKDVADYCSAYLRAVPSKEVVKIDDSATTLGYVYMLRYGKDYKIGRTSSVYRRSRQIQIELPDRTDLIHAILTDDPAGIETYWHRRFQEYRGNGEWFRLPTSAVAAFKKWKKIT